MNQKRLEEEAFKKPSKEMNENFEEQDEEL